MEYNSDITYRLILTLERRKATQRDGIGYSQGYSLGVLPQDKPLRDGFHPESVNKIFHIKIISIDFKKNKK
ncbi:hypothetical protein [Klebsiella pneumoniae]|uniref:hypothetical protein n=1 Tax=Klebsiella pneumoniae TaxID=573 RepID=UPI003F55DFCA